MVQSENSEDEKAKIVVEEVQRFNKLVKGHKKLITAIGKL